VRNIFKDSHSYIAVVSFDEDGISINFPDLQGCFTCAEDESEIFAMSKDILGLHLASMENDGEVIPPPSSIQDINVDSNEVAVLIDVYMPHFRKSITPSQHLKSA
jgi:predicted RNase H-like HicB family nuclease